MTFDHRVTKKQPCLKQHFFWQPDPFDVGDGGTQHEASLGQAFHQIPVLVASTFPIQFPELI